MNKEIYEFEISKNAEGGILATAGVKNAGDSYRIAGPKAWGGSSIIAKIDISQHDLVEFVRFYAPGAYAEIIACDQPTAAPQVVADERELPVATWFAIDHADGVQFHPSEEQALRYSESGQCVKYFSEDQMRAALQAAPVWAQEPVAGKPCPYCGSTDGAHDKAYPHPRAPVQPMAVPDGYEVSDNSETWNAIAAKVREEMATGMAILAAPAAQGDAKELPPLPDMQYLGGDESYGDVIKGYTAECMQQYARAAIAAKAAS